jgi:hypothetical protein
MTVIADSRVIEFDGIYNFRDYGGYRARAGQLVRGRLWRSGQHAGASPADLARVRDLGIATVIDLRGDSERAAFPCLRHDDFVVTNHKRLHGFLAFYGTVVQRKLHGH